MKHYWQCCPLLLFILLLCGTVSAEENSGTVNSSLPTIHTTPSGTFLSLGEKTLMMPGIRLDNSLINTFIRAGIDVTYSKIVHWLLHQALINAQPHLSFKTSIFLGQTVVPLTFSALSIIHRLYKLYEMSAQVWERAQTAAGWRRRGRMPVYVHPVLGRSVFLDVLIQTQESASRHPYELEITPLQPVDVHVLSNSWEKSVGKLVNTALSNNIDLIRVFPAEDGSLTMEQHDRESDQWQEFKLYEPLQENQAHLIQWLENSLWDNTQNIVYTVLEESGLQCISAHIEGNQNICTDLSGISRIAENSTSFSLSSETHNEIWLHVLKNQSCVVGEPGHIVISSEPDVDNSDFRAQSTQYRTSRTLAVLGEALAYSMLVNHTHNFVDAGLNRIRNRMFGLDSYTPESAMSRGRSHGMVYRVKDKEGRTWIKKLAPLADPQGRYSYQIREMNTLGKLGGNGAPQLHKAWLENPGSNYAQAVMLIEDGGQDLESLKPASMEDIQKIMRSSLEAMNSVHTAGIAHYDLKPENMVINGNGQVKIIDFEMSAQMNEEGKAVALIYDPRWKSPEIKKNQPSSWRSDIWSLGLSAVSLFSKSAMSTEEMDVDRLAERLHNPDFLSASVRSSAFAWKLQRDYLFPTQPVFADFLKNMLAIDPDKRSSAADLLKHPFITSN